MSALSGSPYPGTRAFRHDDKDRFFGRSSEASAIADLWRISRLTVVTGPVASGKTSLIQAGVYPLMAKNGADVLPPGSLASGSTFPLAALPPHNPYSLALLRSWSPGESATRLAGLTVRGFIRLHAGGREKVVFAAIDQVEDLLADPGTGSQRMWRRQFLGELAQSVKDGPREEPRLHLLLVTRPEALDLIATALGNGARYQLSPLARPAALGAVSGPLAGTGRSLSAAAADMLVDDLRRSQVGPAGGERYETSECVEPALLQAVCARLWRDLPPEVSVITEWEMRAYADVDTVLAAHAGQEIAAVAAEHDLPAKRVRSVLQDALITASGTRDEVCEGPVTTAGLPNGVLRSLADRHLLATQLKSGVRWYRLLSDRLIEPLRQAGDERVPPPGAAGFLRSAERALNMGELDLAQRAAGQVLRARPSLRLRAEAESLLGNLAIERDKPAEAEPHYREAAALFEAADDTAAAAYQLAAVGQTLLAQGRTAEAVAELRAAADRLRSDPVPQTALALALWHLGESQAALAILNSVLGIDGGNTEALRTRGEILADLGRARDAMLDLGRQAVRDRPSTLAAHGLALAQLGDHPAASREIDDAVARAPRNGPVLLYAARAFELSGDTLSAEDLARRAVDATDPPLAPRHRKIARKLARYR